MPALSARGHFWLDVCQVAISDRHFALNMNAEAVDALKTIEKTVNFYKDNSLLAKARRCDCGEEMHWNRRTDVKDGFTWRCPAAQCRRKKSIRQGLLFAESKLGLPQMLQLTYAWANEMPVSGLGKFLSNPISAKAALSYYEMIREVCSEIISKNRSKIFLGGHGLKVFLHSKVVTINSSVRK